MSTIVEQETAHVMGDDRDFFEEDFTPLVPGSFVELPEGHDVPAADYYDPRFTALLWRGLDAGRSAAARDPVS
ncbi:hypothetical protein [Rhizobium leguminosarum]|uniref:hypothetical protein n=1 Tax=Rhizobium leguminosarum TaxID=384 RepID=UPI001C97B50F|nr:hypothetical protein [Rhizobium leguminosarum]MBY5318213.1 hypothetical protein [Rhizobium leguminosarum]